MQKLIGLKRPPASLIKLVEAVGILLSCPKSFRKSGFKAPIPSNYDATLEFLLDDFYAKLAHLSELRSENIDNGVATEFYNKMLEPGVDYEEAVNVGGLAVRELFNAVLLVLLKLQNDPLRVPIAVHNVLAVVDASRASYIALDTAAHISRHGVLNIFLNTDKQHIVSFLERDVVRRCTSHFKLPDYKFAVHSPFSDSLAGTFAASLNDTADVTESMLLSACVSQANCGAVVVPYSDSLGSFRFLSENTYQHWATWMSPLDVVFTQSMSFVRPFEEISTARTFLVYVDSLDDAAVVIFKALKYFRAGDAIVITAITLSREPLADNRDLRFDFGERQQWIRTEEQVRQEPNRVGWNDERLEGFTSSMYELIQKSFLAGNVRVERTQRRSSVGEMLASVAREEQAAGIMLRLAGNEEVVNELLEASQVALFVLK